MMLMCIHSQNNNVRQIGIRETRSANKFIFKTDARVGSKYENSPFYRGTRLWNKLEQNVQFSEDRWIFRGHI